MEKKNGSRVRIGLYVLFQIYDNLDKSTAALVSRAKNKTPSDENLRRD